MSHIFALQSYTFVVYFFIKYVSRVSLFVGARNFMREIPLEDITSSLDEVSSAFGIIEKLENREINVKSRDELWRL